VSEPLFAENKEKENIAPEPEVKIESDEQNPIVESSKKTHEGPR